MRVALVAPPFLPVPPKKYGGTELFIAQLAEGLRARRHAPAAPVAAAARFERTHDGATILPFRAALTKSHTAAEPQTRTAITEASAPNSPPESHGGPLTVARRSPFISWPETATPKMPPCV